MTKSLIRNISITFFLMACFSSFANENNAVPTSSMELKGQYLFVQNAGKAILTPTEETNTYTLTLKEANPLIIYLSERPNRQSGQMTIQKFLGLWNKGTDSFKKNPPNALLNSVRTNLFHADKIIQYSFMLTKPIFDEKTNTLKYSAKLVGELSKPQEKEIELEHAILFIDDVCLSCW